MYAQLTILNSTGVIARIVAGMLGDIFGIINTLAVMSLVNSVLVFCLYALSLSLSLARWLVGKLTRALAGSPGGILPA